MNVTTVLYQFDRKQNSWTAQSIGPIRCELTSKSRPVLEQVVSAAMLRAGYAPATTEKTKNTLRQQWYSLSA